MAESDRLERIESKLDKLSDAVVAIARTEEQITTIFAAQRSLEARIENNTAEIGRLRERSHDTITQVIAANTKAESLEKVLENYGDLNKLVDKNTAVTGRMEKIAWAVFMTLLGLIGFYIQAQVMT